MGERLFEQKKALQLYLTSYDRKDLDLTENEWARLDEMTKFLKLLKEASDLFCEDKSTLSLQVALPKIIRQEIMKENVASWLKVFQDKICAGLKSKFSGLENEK